MHITLKKPAVKELTCLFSGALVSFAFAPYDYFSLAFIGLALLFAIWLNCTPKQAFISGYLFGLGMFGLGVSWLHISIHTFGGMPLVGAYGLTFLLVAFLAVYPAILGYLARRFFRAEDFVLLAIVFPALWVLAEWCRSWIFTGFPWLNIGYSQIDTPMAGLAPLFGVYGVSWLVAVSAGVMVGLLQSPLKQKLLGLCILLILFSSAWFSTQRSWSENKGETVSAALIQGAIPQELKWLRKYRQPSLELYRELSEPHWDKDLIIWPETAIPAYYHQTTGFIESLRKQGIESGTDLLIGLPVKNLETKDYYNSVVLLNNNTAFYHKRHLVPFGEYLPLEFLFGFIINSLNIPMSDFSPGEQDSTVLTASKMHIGMSICYEDTFGEEVIDALPEADILVNVSNDAWFGDSAAPHQHLQMARMRALETGRYMLRATNTGVSAIIDEKGKLVSTSPQFEATTLAGEVSLFEGATPYVRFGNMPVVLLILLLLAITFKLSVKPE